MITGKNSDTDSVRGANLSVADAAKNVCTHDTLELYGLKKPTRWC